MILLVPGGSPWPYQDQREREGENLWGISVTFPMKIPDIFIIANGPQWLAHGVKTIARRLEGKENKKKFAILSQKRKNSKVDFIIFSMRVGGIHHHRISNEKEHCLRDVSGPPRKQPRSAGAYICLVCRHIFVLSGGLRLLKSTQSSSPAAAFSFSRRNLYSISAEMTRSFMGNPFQLLPFHFLLWQVGRLSLDKTERKPPFSFCVPTYSLFNIPSICYDFCLVVKIRKIRKKKFQAFDRYSKWSVILVLRGGDPWQMKRTKRNVNQRQEN